jgi:trimeric autotransporter adhesin
MGRLASGVAGILIVCGAGFLVGCSHNQAVTTATNGPVPAIITLTPNPTLSLEVGTIASFTATPENNSATSVTTTVSYQSTNPSVLTVSTTGLACAGTWDSLSSPTLCTPGPVGVAQVMATAQGVSSPATTVYVHQHIDSIVVTPVPGQTPPVLGPGPCLSKGQSFEYQATALSQGTDITPTVGTFQWQAVNTSVVSLATVPVATSAGGLQPGQTLATANIPGTTTIFANASNTASTPFTFTTCAVQSITLAVDGAASNSVAVAPNGTLNITATVIDTNHNSITGTFLTWCSTNPSSVSVGSANCATGSTTSFAATAQTAGGGASIIASCTPPACNIGFVPALPIYPSYPYIPSQPPAPVPTLQPLWVQVSVSSNGGTTTSTSSSTSTNTWVTSTGCGTLQGCVSEIVEIASTSPSTSSPSSTGAGVALTSTLPATPNSLVFDPKGAVAFLGTDRGELGTKGVMVLNPTGGTSVLYPSAVGKVLAVSPDGTVAVLSDTVDTPNQVYIFTCAGAGTGTCSSTTSVPLNITGATAAAFSSDGLKAFILANNGNASTLYIYSNLDALETVALSSTAPATDIAFQAEGGFAYIAGGAPAAVSTLAVCSDLAAPAVTTTPTAGTPLLIRALPNGYMLALDPPGFDLLVPTVAVSSNGCSVPRPPYAPGGIDLSVSNSASFLNLGLGNFVPTQLIVSNDGSAAYLLANHAGSVLVSNLTQRTTSAIQLTGNVLPVQAALNPAGSNLYVAASDGSVHILDTLTENDIQQISLQQDLANLQTGLCGDVTLPLEGTINITAAAESGSSTTYTYALSSVPALEIGTSIAVANMGNPGNNGTFTVESVGFGTFTVFNPAGVSASGQSGTGTFSFTCNPDLIAIEP